MPEFEEWSEKREAKSRENSVGQIPDKNQARYALKRGRIPQTRNFSESDEIASANVVDVEHDAIGSRSKDEPVPPVPRESPIKKSTEIIEKIDPAILGKPSHSHSEIVGNKHGPKSKFQSYDKIIPEQQPSAKCRYKLLEFWKKLLKFFGVKSKNCKDSNNKVVDHTKIRHGQRSKGFSHSQYQSRKNNFHKKVK
ncbi:MAG: hypothetical protein LBB16_03100 [Puniceicoccales bacterium]|jgi:hypothetical protein|nr:hypothetical protein [Puniceicoccales bacterium]